MQIILQAANARPDADLAAGQLQLHLLLLLFESHVAIRKLVFDVDCNILWILAPYIKHHMPVAP